MLTASAAIALYICATLFQALQLRKHPNLRLSSLQLIAVPALALHGYTSAQWIFSDVGLDFGLLPMTSAIVFTINLIVLLSSLRKPVHSLFLILFPLAALILALTLLIGSSGALRRPCLYPSGRIFSFP